MKRISLLGSTGSIGRQTLDVVRCHPADFKVAGLGCNSSTALLEKQIREFRPQLAAVYQKEAAEDLAVRIKDLDTRVVSGMEGLTALAAMDGADIFVTGNDGMIGIRPTVAAIEAGHDIAFANKETCVTAGNIIIPLARKKGVRILPVDSEHSAIFQALQGRADSVVHRILLTASGGPFFGKKKEELEHITVKEALAHPTWNMGPKVTVDSATMVNKGLEVIEAKWLFGIPADRIKVVIQRESLVHSAVEYEDGSILAQMGPSDMRIPIQFALTYPNHVPSPAEYLDFDRLSALHFDRPDNETFRGLPLAYEAIASGGTMTTVFNAANEWANKRFRAGSLGFLEIYDVIESAMAQHRAVPDPSLEEIFAAEQQVYRYLEEKYH